MLHSINHSVCKRFMYVVAELGPFPFSIEAIVFRIGGISIPLHK